MQRIFFVLLLVPLFCAVPAHGGMYIVQNEPHLAHARALIRAALDAVGFQADFQDAPSETNAAMFIKSAAVPHMWI